MNDSTSIIVGFFLYIMIFIIIIGLPIYLIKRLVKRRKNKSTDPLKKGVFNVLPDEQNKGVIGFSVAGVTYRDDETKDHIYSEFNFLELGDEFILEREPHNEYDKNAIKVLSKYGTHYGYVPRHLTYLFLDSKSNLLRYNCRLSGLQRGIYINVFIKCYPLFSSK